MGSRRGAVRGPLDPGLQSYDGTCVSGCWSPRDICAERSDASRGKGARKLAGPVTVLPFVAGATQAQATSVPEALLDRTRARPPTGGSSRKRHGREWSRQPGRLCHPRRHPSSAPRRDRVRAFPIRVWQSLVNAREPLSPLTQDACAFFQDHTVHRRYSGLVFDESDGYEIAASLGANKAVVLQNHGLLTVGASVGAAVWWFLAMERAWQCEILARSAGTPIPIDHEAASLTWRQIGGEASGRFIFSSLADELPGPLGGFEALD
jgi:Class II Aldolase and Adducin N-terminal domain